MYGDDAESFPTLLAGEAPHRFPIFEHLLDLCWSESKRAAHTPPPPVVDDPIHPVPLSSSCPLLGLHSSLHATEKYFADPSHALDPPPATVAQVESEREGMGGTFNWLVKRGVDDVEGSGMREEPAAKALVAHAHGILDRQTVDGDREMDVEGSPSRRGGEVLSTEEVMRFLLLH